MPAVVSEASLVRAPSHSQAAGNRSQAGADQASSPFSELLENCETPDTGTTDSAPKAADDKAAEAAPPKDKADKADAPAKAEDGVPADTAAELALVIAAAGQQPAPQETEGELAIPVVPVESGPVEAQPDADVPQTDAAATDAPAVAQPATPPVATPVPAAVPAPQEAVVVTTSADAEAVSTVALAAPETKPANGIPVTETKSEAPSKTPEVAPEMAEVPPKADAAVSKTANPAPARTENAARAEEMPTAQAETKTAPESKPAPSAAPEPSADVEAAQKPASRPADSAAPIARSIDVDPQPKMTATQPSAETAVNSAALPAPAVTQTVAHHAAQPSAPQPTPHADKVPVAGLAVEIVARVQNGENRFEIRLDPPELGRIDVRLHIDSEGQVTSHLRVERAETLDMLRRDAPALERALQQAGLKTSDNGLQFSLRDQSFSQQNQGRDTPAVTRIVVPDESLVPVETQRHYGRLAGLGSGVDIRV